MRIERCGLLNLGAEVLDRLSRLHQVLIGGGADLRHGFLQGLDGQEHSAARHVSDSAAGCGTGVRGPVGVTGNEADLFDRNSRSVSGQLGQHGVVALAGVGDGPVDGEPSVRIELHGDRGLVRRSRLADAEAPPGDADSSSLPAVLEGRRLAQGAPVMGTQGLEAAGKRPLCDHLPGGSGLTGFEGIGEAELERVGPDFSHQQFDRRLQGKVHLRRPGPAGGPAPGVVGVNQLSRGFHVRDVIAAAQHLQNAQDNGLAP